MSILSDPIPDEVFKRLSAACAETGRLQKLSNEELVREYLKLTSDQDDELHVDEMCSRLFPDWETAEL